jgi:hypothetical protein
MSRGSYDQRKAERASSARASVGKAFDSKPADKKATAAKSLWQLYLQQAVLLLVL